MFEKKIYKFFAGSKIVGVIKDVSWRPLFTVSAIFKWRCRFIQRPEQPFITSYSRQNSNKLIKYKIFTIKFSFQKFKIDLIALMIKELLKAKKPGQNFRKKICKVIEKEGGDLIQSLHLWALLSPNMDIIDWQTYTKKCLPNDFSKLAAWFARWRIIRSYKIINWL